MNAVAAECTCPVCTAHRLHPLLPEHVQETQLRQEHAARVRAHRRARFVGWGLGATLLALGVLVAIRALMN